MHCCARHLFLRISRLCLPQSRDKPIRGLINVNNQVAVFDDKKLAYRLSGARNPFSAFQSIQFFRGTTVAENEILRRDELKRVYLSKWKKGK
jgi:hypothetical protein